MGKTNITAMQADATVYNPDFSEKFDAVLCDVPCSGLGIIRRKPDIKYKKDNDFYAYAFYDIKNDEILISALLYILS